MTRVASEALGDNNVREQQVKSRRVHTVEIKDPEFDEIYTVYLKKRKDGWSGWIPDVPGVECKARTKAAVLKMLAVKLQKALIAEEEAWEKQFEEDVKAGRLDSLAEQAAQNYRDGKCYDLETLKKLTNSISVITK